MSDTSSPIEAQPIPDSFMFMSFDPPPVYEEILRQFNINVKSTLFTFGDVLHNPQRLSLDKKYIKHEEVHADQHGHTPEGAGIWWARYLQDPYFRIDQEARAYARQYDYFCSRVKDRERRNREMHECSMSLSSPMYGSVVGYQGAMSLIKSHSKKIK